MFWNDLSRNTIANLLQCKLNGVLLVPLAVRELNGVSFESSAKFNVAADVVCSLFRRQGLVLKKRVIKC